ncbi:MAG: translocation/assembly module TamB domain-containing protein [Alphaproteobacteria bacterium]|nr:translocation/assembly module TamB domain-containing protein [Alphaproteobacteria bacterium]
MKRILIRIGFGAVGLAGLLVLASAALYSWSQSDSGRRWLAGRIAQIASTPGERDVTVGHFEGDFYRRIRLRDIAVKDSSDAWLTIRYAEILWKPELLLRGRLHLQALHLSGVRIDRLPATTDDSDSSASSLESIRRLPSITVNALTVDDLRLGAPVFGAAATVQIKGAVENGAEDAVTAKLSVQRSDGPLGTLRLDAGYQPVDGRLRVDLDLVEDAGGLIARALGVRALPALQGSLKGDGPLSQWQGRLATRFDGAASASADIGIQVGDTLKFQATGTADLAKQSATMPGSPWLGSHRYRISGRYDDADVLQIDLAEWEGEALQATLAGRLDTGDLTVDARGTLESVNGYSLPIDSGRAAVERITLQAKLTNSVLAPNLALEFKIGRLALPDLAVAGFAGTTTFRTTRLRNGQVAVGEVAGSGSIDGVEESTAPPLRKIFDRPTTWKVEGSVDLDQSTVQARSLSLVNAIADLTGAGSFSMADGTGAAKLSLRASDLLPLGEAFGRPVEGRAELSLEGTVAKFGAALDAKLSGRISGLDVTQPVVGRLIDGGIRVGGAVALKSEELTFSDVTLASRSASVRIDARLPLEKMEIDARYSANIPAGVSLAPANGAQISCACTAKGTVTGNVNDPYLVGDLSMNTAVVGQIRLNAIKSQYDIQHLATAPRGSVKISARTEHGPAKLRADVHLVDDVLRLTAFHIDGAGVALDGAVAIPASGAPLTGDLRLEIAKLRPLLRIAGAEGDGQGTGHLKLFAREGRQRADANVVISNAEIGTDGQDNPVRAGKLSISAASNDLFAGKQLSLTIEIEDAAVGTASFRRISLSATGSPERAEIGIEAAGQWIDPLTAKAALVFSGKADRYDILMNTLSGETLGRKFTIGQPFRVHWTTSRVVLDDFVLTLGDARAAASVKLLAKSIDGTISLSNWPLATLDRVWSSGLAGTLNATASVTGTRAKPTGTLAVKIPNLRLASEAQAAAFGLAIQGAWRDGRMRLKAELSNPKTPPATADADLPFRLATDHWGVVLPQNDPISASANWRGDTATLWKFVPFAWHQLAGPGLMDAKLSGTFANPKMQGRLAIENGTYESLQLGTVLKPLDLAIEFDGTKGRLTRFSARDGNAGTMTAAGSVTLDPALRYPFEFDLTLEKFAVARRDDLEASASGKVTAKGVLDDAKITGRLKTETVELRVLDQLPPDVVDLKVVVEGRSKAGAGRAPKRPEPRFDPALDIVVTMPGRVFVRGRGIDSEWKGKMALAGTLETPRVSGTMNVVKGQMSVIGKVFRVTRGTVVLPESNYAEPEILLTAVHEGKRLTAEAHAAGPITKPKITLSSTPDFPQDEIVSQILFNKSAARLSGIEAAQLALALAQLSGAGGSGAGFLDFARKTLGVDVLRIDTATTAKGDQPSVGAGKYLTEEVYLGVKQGATPESGSVGVQVEVMPNITVESEVRRSGTSDVGVKFKLDY